DGERGQLAFAVAGFPGRAQHAGAHVRGAGPGCRAVHGHRAAPAGQPPGDRQPDDPAADHRDAHQTPTEARSSLVAAAGSAASLTALTTATPCAPAASSSGIRSAVTAPIAMTGMSTASATARIPGGPMGSGRPSFVDVR